jgi:bifunctional non-homologous end joining protein LigD
VTTRTVRSRARPPVEGARAEVAGVAITHPDRVVFPELGLSKRDLASYYAEVSEWILPHVARRPLSLLRCPEGRGKACFVQKHPGPAGLPPHVEPVNAGDKGSEPFISVTNVKGLVALIQMGGLELHPWGTRVDRLERPDRLILDLDPAPGVGWARVVEAAFRMRELLADQGLTSFVKTTGGKGLHVVAPIARASGWPVLQSLARALAETAATRWPRDCTARMAKADRTGKIFVDYLRNARGATAVAAYSTRARPGAPVATPVGWDELAGLERSDRFTVESLPRRLARLRTDPWDGFFELRQAMPAPAPGRAIRR